MRKTKWISQRTYWMYLAITNYYKLDKLSFDKFGKLPTIRADLVRPDNDWQEWDFSQFIEALRK